MQLKAKKGPKNGLPPAAGDPLPGPSLLRHQLPPGPSWGVAGIGQARIVLKKGLGAYKRDLEKRRCGGRSSTQARLPRETQSQRKGGRENSRASDKASSRARASERAREKDEEGERKEEGMEVAEV